MCPHIKARCCPSHLRLVATRGECGGWRGRAGGGAGGRGFTMGGQGTWAKSRAWQLFSSVRMEPGEQQVGAALPLHLCACLLLHCGQPTVHVFPCLPPCHPPRRQLLLYPRGNNRPDSLSLYLAVAEDDQQAFGLQRTAVFKLMILNQAEGADLVKDTQHTFTVRETDWGEAGWAGG